MERYEYMGVLVNFLRRSNVSRLVLPKKQNVYLKLITKIGLIGFCLFVGKWGRVEIHSNM